MKTVQALLALTALACAAAPGRAADYPGYAVAPVVDSLWLGHFSGGRNLAPGVEPIPLDWIDVKQNFASLRDCSVWMKGLSRDYATYEGWKTCVRIR